MNAFTAAVLDAVGVFGLHQDKRLARFFKCPDRRVLGGRQPPPTWDRGARKRVLSFRACHVTVANTTRSGPRRAAETTRSQPLIPDERNVIVTTPVSLILIAAIGGIAVALQAQFMGLMDQHLGTLESVFITYGSGGLLVGVVMIWVRGGNLAAWQTVPWFALLSGILGLVIVASIGYGTARLGLVTAMTVIIAAQFTAGAIVDHFGWLGAELRPLNVGRTTGIGLMLLGTWLVVR